MPVEKNEFTIHGEDCFDLGGSNPPLQILQKILVAFGACRERTVHKSNGFILAPPAVHAPDPHLRSAYYLETTGRINGEYDKLHACLFEPARWLSTI